MSLSKFLDIAKTFIINDYQILKLKKLFFYKSKF